jgi:hypothetical protein
MSIKSTGLSRLEENRRKAEAEKLKPVKKAEQPIRPEPIVVRTGIGWVLDRDGFPTGGCSMPSQDFGPGRWPDDVTPRYKRD